MNKGSVDVGGDNNAEKDKLMEVGVTKGDGVEKAVEQYITSIASFID